MNQAAVIYAPASPEMGALADSIAQKLKARKLKVSRKEAAQAIVPDLTAADLLVLGSGPGATAPIHEDFAEILRALQGISLAGRTIGVFAVQSPNTLAAFEKALSDCDVPLPARHLVSLSGAKASDSELGPWLSSLVEQLERRGA
jgi:flavodoxin